MDIREVKVQLLKDLFASETGLLPYTLYKRYDVTPVDLVRVVKQLQKEGIVQLVNDNRTLLTKVGREKTEGLISSLTKKENKRIQSKYINSITINKLDKKIPYIPRIHFFEQYKKEGEENG